MNFYPIKKMMKDYEVRYPDRASANKSPVVLNNSRSISIKEEFLKQYLSQRDYIKRLDREFTLSWADKQISKLNTPKGFANKAHSFTQTFTSPVSPSSMGGQSPNIAIHFSSEQDEERIKAKIYPQEVYQLRRQNEEGVSHSLTLKTQYKENLNRISQQAVGIKGQRSGLTSSGTGLTKTNIYSMSRDGNMSPELQPEGQLKSFKPGESSNLEETQGEVQTLTKSFFLGTEPAKDRSNVLENLEEIYYKDLKEETQRVMRPKPLVQSPYKKEFVRKKRYPKSIVESVDCGHLIDDNVFLAKLEDPYKKHIPFEKPINANIKDYKSSRLKELEIKAEILRNIKSVHKEIVKSQEKDGKKVRSSPTWQVGTMTGGFERIKSLSPVSVKVGNEREKVRSSSPKEKKMILKIVKKSRKGKGDEK